MTVTLAELVDRLLDLEVLTPDDGQAVAADGVATEARGRLHDRFGAIDEQGVPELWWTRSLAGTDAWFAFAYDEIADTQIDDGLLDRIAPAVAAHGVELVHDWNRGDQPEDPEHRRIWVNDAPVTYAFPPAVGCVQPLVRVNELLSEAGAAVRFYFSGVQWEQTGEFFIGEDIVTVLMPVEAAQLLADSPFVAEAARPHLVESILPAR